MAIVKMQRISICGLKKDRRSMLERLQSLGMIEINFRKGDTDELKCPDTSEQRSDFEKKAAHTDQALELLTKYAPEKTSLLDSLAGKPLIEYGQYEENVQKQNEYLDAADRILNLEKKISDARSEISRYQNQIEMLQPWMELDIPMNFSGTEQTVLMLGTVPVSAGPAQGQLEEAFRSAQEPLENVYVQTVHTDKDEAYLAVMCMKNEKSRAEDILRSTGFAKLSAVPERTPKEEEECLQGEIAQCENAIQSWQKEIADMAPMRAQLKLTADYCRVAAERCGVMGKLPQTEKTFALSGYVPAGAAEGISRDIRSRYTADVEIEELDEKEEAPVLLKNNAFSESVEGVLSSFGLPKKGEFDPTCLMSIFYVFFFGLMLSDAAYGAIISVACAVLLLKFPRMDIGLRKSLKLFFWCGISTLFWGVMFGGYFGDVVTVVARTFFHKEVTINAVWFVPLNEPMRMLMYSLLFGLIHLFMGLALKGYMMLRDKDIVGFVSDVLSWFLFLIGLILILLPTSLFYSISQMEFNFGPGMQMAAKVMAVVGAVIILVMSGRRKKKKIGIRLALGLYDLYNITGWLSDVLSYSRLLALGLATGVIAQVVNQMGSMLGDGVIGAIFFIIVFIIGHVFNMAINVLGAYVHTNRLQFVEFFGKFYEGGGKPFEPFRANTKYVDIQEEK